MEVTIYWSDAKIDSVSGGMSGRSAHLGFAILILLFDNITKLSERITSDFFAIPDSTKIATFV